MLCFKNLTPTNGFDNNDLNNARQNNYAWSMAELGKYIYVGTGRNIVYDVVTSFGATAPPLVSPYEPATDLAEIWRYNTTSCDPWQRVYKSTEELAISGFRFMLSHRPADGYPFLYAAGYSFPILTIFKSTNGVNWFPLDDIDGTLQGTSSRGMVSHKGKLYLSTINEAIGGDTPLLYSSIDPQYFPWKLEIDPSAINFNPDLNPQGAIDNIAVFNDKIYVSTSTSNGCQVWRTNCSEPKVNDWTLIVDNGFGDAANKYTLSIGVFKDYLYVSGTKQLPLSWLIPLGCDVIRIDKNDNWQLVVGGRPIDPLPPSKGTRGESLSGLKSGFNNPFNVYSWQINQYNNKLFISTFDDSSNMEVILGTLLANKEAIISLINSQGLDGKRIVEILIEIYATIVEMLNRVHYPFGFDLYESIDGIHFKPIFLNGLNNPYNYGGRMLFVDSKNQLFLGTANPFQGCEVWITADKNCGHSSCCNTKHNVNDSENSYDSFLAIEKLVYDNLNILKTHLPLIVKFLPQHFHHKHF